MSKHSSIRSSSGSSKEKRVRRPFSLHQESNRRYEVDERAGNGNTYYNYTQQLRTLLPSKDAPVTWSLQVPSFKKHPGLSAINIEISRTKDEAIRNLRSDRISEALEKLTSSIETASEYFGKDSPQFIAIFQELMQIFCDQSMRVLSGNEFEKAIEILSVCNSMTEPMRNYEQIPEKRILVLNNLGCVFRKMGRLGKARLYLEEALSLVQKFPLVKYSGVTYMNICAIVSQAGMRDRALAYARQGLIECQQQLIDYLKRGAGPPSLNPHNTIPVFEDGQLEEKVKFTAISFHNVAIEEEYFKNYEKAKEAFRQSFTLFEVHGLSLKDPLYLKFKESYSRFTQNGQNQSGKNSSLEPRQPTLPTATATGVLGKRTDMKLPITRVSLPHQHATDGFVFQNNKLVSKNRQSSEGRYAQTALNRTIPYKNDNNSTDFYEDQGNSRLTLKKNNFVESNEELSLQIPATPIQVLPAQRRSSIQSVNRSSRASSLQSAPRRPSTGDKKEIMDLNLIGILNWSESGESDDNDEFELSNKKNRIDFIKQMQNEVKSSEGDLVNQVKTEEPEYDEDFEENLKEIEEPKQPSFRNSTRQQNSPPEAIETEKSFEESFEKDIQKIPLIQSQIQQPPTPPLSNQQQMSPRSNSSPKSITKSKRSVKSAITQPNIRSSKDVSNDYKSVRQSQKIRSSSAMSQQDIDLLSQGYTNIYETKIYSEHEENQVRTIVEILRRLNKAREHKQKQALIVKKKLIALRNLKAKEAVLKIQRATRLYLLRRNAKDNQKVCKKTKEWQVCLMTNTQIRFVPDINVPNRELWRFYNLHSQESEIVGLRIFRITVSYDKKMRLIKIQTLSKDTKKSELTDRYELVLDLQILSNSSQFLKHLNCSSRDLKSHGGIKMMAQNLLPYLLIYGEQLKISISDDSVFGSADDEPLNHLSNYVPAQPSLQDMEYAALKIQSFFRRKMQMDRMKLKLANKIQILKTWVFQTDINGMQMFNLRFYFKKAENEYGFLLKDLDSLLFYPALYLPKQHIPIWRNHQIQGGISDYFDIDSSIPAFFFSGLFYKNLGIKNQNPTVAAVASAGEDGFAASTYTLEYYQENIKSIIKIQSAFKGFLTRKIYLARIAKLREQRILYTEEEGEPLVFICKTGYVFQSIESFLIQMLYKPAAVKKQNNFIGNSSFFSKKTYSQILITCVSLDRKTIFGEIETVKQAVSQEITLSILQRFGPRMLKHTFMKMARNTLKIVVPNIQTVMLEQQNEIRLREGKEIKVHDPDFRSKLIYNKRTMVHQRSQYKSLVNFCKFDANQSKNIEQSKIGELCQRTIFYKFHNFQDHRKVEILTAKGIKDHSQLKKKALLDFPTEQFSKNILKFMEHTRFSMDENVATKPKIDASIVELNKQCLIGEKHFSLDIYYDSNERQVIVVSQAAEQLKAISQVIIGIGQLAMNEWSIESLSENLSDVLIAQLRQRNLVLYFEENKVLKRKQEIAAAQIKEQQQTGVISQFQQKKLDEKDKQLQVFLFNMSAGLLLLEISQQSVTGFREAIELKLNWFGCFGLMRIVEEKAPEELEKFFYPLVERIRDILNVKWHNVRKAYTYNLEETRIAMPVILQNYFASKIQKMFLTRITENKYSFTKQFCSQQQILLHSEVTDSQNFYFEKRWYLVRDRFKLFLVIEKYPKLVNKGIKKVLSVNLLEIKQTFSDIANSKGSRTLQGIPDDCSFLLRNRWTDIQGLHQKQYYEQIFFELIKYLNKKIQISIIYSKIFIEMTDPRINFQEEKQASLQKRTILDQKKQYTYEKFRSVISAVTCVQRTYRKFKKQEWQMLKSDRKKETESFTKTIGPRVKRAFVSVDGCMYIANVYQRENVFTFDLVLYNDRREKKMGNLADIAPPMLQSTTGVIKNLQRKKKKKNLRGIYEYDNNQLLNTGSLTIPEYLLQRITIQDEEVIFKESAFIEHNPKAYQNVKRNELEINQQMYNQEQLLQLSLRSDQTIQKAAPIGTSNVASNLVNYLFHEDQGKQYIYNVVYTGEKPVAHDAKPQIIGGKKEAIFSRNPIEQNLQDIREEAEEGEEKEGTNIIKINVDLNELKKLYPSVDQKSQGLMKVIGEQLIDGIKMNDRGKVEIDQSKINPKCIEVEENSVNIDALNKQLLNQPEPILLGSIANNMQGQKQDQTVLENRKILLKQTRFFSKQKYLILIYNIERKVKKINNTAFDTVFEEYEVLYQINCINLALKAQNPIIWEITPEEVMLTSDGIKDNMERARFLMRHIQIFNSKIIFTVQRKQQVTKIRPNPVLIVYYEQGLIPIQNHFRNRRFRRNFQMYKEEIRTNHAKIIHKCIPDELRSLTQYYLFAAIDLKELKDKWELIAWDMITFERFAMKVKSTEFQTYLSEFGKQVTIEFMAKFIEINIQSGDLTLNPGILDYFRKCREDLKRKKFARDIIEKKRLKYNH